jgi:hypothetical protein
MLIYRFRITSEEHEAFLREIEIQPKQKFFDFHLGIIESAELLHCERASFFPTDKKYKKDKEITLKSEKRQVRKYDEDLDQVITEVVPLRLMKNEKVKDYIEDPHQRLIYEFHGRENFTFFIELFKILQVDGYEFYPRCVKSSGNLPKKAELPAPQSETPVPPKIVIPKIPLPKPEELARFGDMVEDEAELARIEEDLDSLINDEQGQEQEQEQGQDQEQDHAGVFESSHIESSDEDDFSYGHGEEHIEHIEDYEDIENLEKRFSGYDKDSDDY